jgi:AcrR family transcriptional regulator
MTPRLDAEERRSAILEAALPLFARKGFNATTTREIAAVAGVSEGLIFKHFPSKAALYDAILRSGCESEPELERLAALTPSTATLVQLVSSLLRYFLVELPSDPSGKKARHRLMLASLLEDGDFARLAYGWLDEVVQPIFRASLAAAETAGDLLQAPVAPESRFLFAEHLASMLAAVRLPDGIPVSGQRGAAEQVAHEASWFILRGLGVRDEVIGAHLGTARNQVITGGMK